MRTSLLALGVLTLGLLAASVLVVRRGELPPIATDVEPLCAETMQGRAADLSWVAPRREEMIRGRWIETVGLNALPAHNRGLVRVAGVLHVAFESVALYPSRAAMAEQPSHAPWVALGALWPDEPYWTTKGPSISDRCAVVEGTYESGAGGHFGAFTGTIRDVLRLEVWSTPHRPFVATPPPPPPPPATADATCADEPSPPKPLPDPKVGQAMLAAFNTLYETGEFQLGYCLADVHVNESGTVDRVRVVRPKHVDPRVASAIVGAMSSGRYTPATACGRRVPFVVTVGVGHCPARAAGGRPPGR